MAVVSSQAASTAGTTPTYSSASGGGDTLNLDPAGNILIVKTVGTAATVTCVTPGTVAGLAVADNAVALSTNAERWIDLNYSVFGDANGQCAITWSATTAVTFALVRR